MTQKSWPWSTAAAVGDGSAELNEASSREFLAHLWAQDLTAEGVFKGLAGDLAGELEVAGASSPLTVQPGAAICYGLFMSDAVENLSVSTPSVGTTGFRVVLRTNWAGTSDGDVGEARTRLAVVESSDGASSIPALTQSFGVTWEISLATGTITTGGAITLTDDRTFRKATGITDTDELEDLAVTTAKLAASAVTAAKIAAGAVDTDELAADAVTAAKIANRARRFLASPTNAFNSTDGTFNYHASRGIAFADAKYVQAGISFRVPADFASGMTVKAVVDPGGSGDIYAKLTANYGAAGEAYNTHTQSDGLKAVAVTANQIAEILELSLSGIAAGDYVSVFFERDGAHVNDTIGASLWLRGMIVEYTADS